MKLRSRIETQALRDRRRLVQVLACLGEFHMLVGFSKLGSLQPLRSVARMAQIAFRCACVWMALAAPVLAQVPEEETPEKTYVPCYLIIFFGVSLGLMMICRAGKRTLDFRRPD